MIAALLLDDARLRTVRSAGDGVYRSSKGILAPRPAESRCFTGSMNTGSRTACQEHPVPRPPWRASPHSCAAKASRPHPHASPDGVLMFHVNRMRR